MITVEGNAKINLTLDILGKRPDGYHEVAMVMQSINLHDTLTLSKIPSGIELTLDVPGLEADERNLAWRETLLALPPGRYVVAVGALHLYGEGNLPDMLT